MLIETSNRFILKGEICNHFGHEVLYAHLRFSTLEAMFDIDYEVQRQLDVNRRQEIRHFIIESITSGMPLYFSPFVFSARGQIVQRGQDFELTPGSKLYLLDGMHRSKALSSAITFLMSESETLEKLQQHDNLRKYQTYIHSLKNYPITLQIYLNLTKQQERQAFSDLNSRRREAHSGLLLKYDQRDTYNQLTRTVASHLQNRLDIEMDASRIGTNSASITSLTLMKKCLLALFEGIVGEKKVDPKLKLDGPQYAESATAFFESWVSLFPKNMHNRKKYVCGLAGIQISLAQTVFLLTIQHNISYLEAIRRLQKLKNICTWHITDTLFAHMYNKNKKVLERHSSSTSIRKTTMNFLNVLNDWEG